MEKKPLKLKRHETFSIREGWLEKAINNININFACFSKDNGTKEFGLGSNMVKSLRFWVQACGIVSFGQKGGFLTNFGALLLSYDRYLESDFSWWMIHMNLSTNFDDAPVINSFFNMPYSTFDKDFVFRYLKDKFNVDGYEIGSESSLDSDISILIKSYFSDDYSNPEDNMNCPLAKLNLLSTLDKKTYKKVTPAYDSLNFKIVYYSIIKCFEEDGKTMTKLSFNLEDLYDRKNNPLIVFNISKSMLFLYLEEMRKNGYIDLIKTAGLNTVYINEIKSLNELFKSYFKEGA